MCYENQVDYQSEGEASSQVPGVPKLKGKYKEGISVLGMVTLSDLDMLHAEGRTGRGWIACKWTRVD